MEATAAKIDMSKPKAANCGAKSLVIVLMWAEINISGADTNVQTTIQDAIWNNLKFY